MRQQENAAGLFKGFASISPLILVVSFFLAGCIQHEIRFEEIGYTLGQKQLDAGLIAVITPETIAQRKPINSFMTGAAHTWEARSGEMLQQIAEVELPQMFRYYRTSSAYEEPKEGLKRLTVELALQHYDFSDFHATVVMQAKGYGAGTPYSLTSPIEKRAIHRGPRCFGVGLLR